MSLSTLVCSAGSRVLVTGRALNSVIKKCAGMTLKLFPFAYTIEISCEHGWLAGFPLSGMFP